ncbi:MAG: hypothetical protein ACREJ2_13845 [Planctomycetota bacterium]
MVRALSLHAALAALLLCGFLAGCGEPSQIDITSRTTYDIYTRGDPQAAVNYHSHVSGQDNSYGLDMSMLTSAYLAMGDYDDAYRALHRAYDLMNGFISDQGGAKHFYKPESVKTWIGDQVEIALNSWYMAILDFRREDMGNCVAACKNAILADQPLKWEDQTAEEAKKGIVPKTKYVDDMGMIYLLEARAMMDGTGWTQADIDRVVAAGKDAFLRTPLFDPSVAKDKVNELFQEATDPKMNVIFVVDLGLCPKHVRAGEYGDRVRIRPVDYPDKNARIVVNGDALATDRVCDVYYQKVHRGGREFDETLQGRALFKQNATEGGKAGVIVGATLMTSDNAKVRAAGAVVAGVGALFWVLGANTHPEADLRQWEALPGQINMAFTTLKPGTYTVRCEALGIDQNPLGDPRDCVQTVVVPATGDQIVYLRPLPACAHPTPPNNPKPASKTGDTDQVRAANDNGNAAFAQDQQNKQNQQQPATPTAPAAPATPDAPAK